MTRRLYVLGGGGHAREIASIAADCGLAPALVVPTVAERDALRRLGYECVCDEEALTDKNEMFSIGVGDPGRRAELAARHPALDFPALVSPEASVGALGPTAKRARGLVLFPGARLTADISLGDFAHVSLNATISHDCEIGAFSMICPGANIAGQVRVGQGAWVGIGASVLQGRGDRPLSIGDWAVIGAGAVVISDCEARAVYAGVPARRLPCRR